LSLLKRGKLVVQRPSKTKKLDNCRLRSFSIF